MTGVQTCALPIFTINVPVTAASTHTNAGKYGVVLAGLLLLPFAGMKRIRKRFGRMSMVLLLLLAGGAMSALTGCGAGNGIQSEPPNSYQVTLTVTSGTISHSVPFTLNVE